MFYKPNHAKQYILWTICPRKDMSRSAALRSKTAGTALNKNVLGNYVAVNIEFNFIN